MRAIVRVLLLNLGILSFPAVCLALLLGASSMSRDEVWLVRIALAVFGPFASSIWLAGVIRWCQRSDFRRTFGKEDIPRQLRAACYAFVGFAVSLFAGGYVAMTQDDAIPAIYFSKAVVACFSPTIGYLVYRIYQLLIKHKQRGLQTFLQEEQPSALELKEEQKERKKRVRTERRLDQHREKARQQQELRKDRTREVDPDCVLLGVYDYYTLDELSAARRTKAAQWHADKLENMAPELREYASQQLARFNGAYERLANRVKWSAEHKSLDVNSWKTF